VGATLAIVSLGGASAAFSQTSANNCSRLTGLKLPHVAITGAAMQNSFCRVKGTASPTSDSQIGFEVWIPNNWNGRYLQLGNGGFAGAIPEAGMIAGIAQGYAVAGTDGGHRSEVNTDASWALNHREKQIDFGYRALKETTDAAKAIIGAYTGKAPQFSYFSGCSDGGREALMEAQRFPRDFDGIVAGDPANYWTRLMARGAWNAQALYAMSPASWLYPEKLKLIQAEAVRQCGDQDGVIQNPEGCKFRPERIRCKELDAPDCLTDAHLATLAKIYGGPRNPRTGEKIIGGFSPGGEDGPQGWVRWITGSKPGVQGPLLQDFASNFFRYIVHADPNYQITLMNFDSDVARTDFDFAPIFNSDNPDLSAFKARGGKLIQYHGWTDPAIPPQDSIDYYKSVQVRMGDTRAFYRLFMAPGMMHCRYGPGPNVLATLPAIRAWVEDGKAPERILATKYQDDDISKPVVRTRPLCAWPARARWDGKGDKTKHKSFRCG
jgi:feruloyl esterase